MVHTTVPFYSSEARFHRAFYSKPVSVQFTVEGLFFGVFFLSLDNLHIKALLYIL